MPLRAVTNFRRAEAHARMRALGALLGGLGFGLLAGACGQGHSDSQVLVVVDADETLVSRLDVIEAETARQRRVIARAPTASHLDLPLSFAVVNDGAAAVRVSVRGLEGESLLVERSAEVRFREGERLAWYVYLNSRCPNQCASGETCDACGQCGPLTVASLESVHGDELASFPVPMCPPHLGDADAGGGEAAGTMGGDVHDSSVEPDSSAGMDGGDGDGGDLDADVLPSHDAEADAALAPTVDAASVAWSCTSGACTWGTSGHNYAVAWPLALQPQNARALYSNDQPIYLGASHAQGITVRIVSGTAGIFAGTDTGDHRTLATLEAGATYLIQGLFSDDLVSVQSETPFSYQLSLP